MSPLNGLQGQHAGRTAARTPAQEQQGQPAWGQPPQQAQWGQAQPAPQAAPAYDPNAYGQQGYGAPAYGQPGYGVQSAAPGYGQGQDYQYPQQQPQDAHYANGPAGSSTPHAPQFEPYVAAAPQPAPRAQPAYQAAPQQGYAPLQQGYNTPDPRSQGHGAGQWPAQTGHDPRGFELGGYLPQGQQAQQPAAYRQDPHLQDQDPAYAEWNQAQGGPDLGFAEPAGGELEPAYGDEEAQDYEPEEPRRGRRPMMIAAALAGAILVGGGMAYSYKAVFGRASSGDPPVIKSAVEPSKIKPADAGGKQFAHTDSKIMGRLGDGTSAASLATGETDPNGTRKVATVVVGRDGSIQAPASADAPAPAEAPVAAAPASSVAVPGMMVVDGLGTSRQAAAAPAAARAAAAAAPAVQQKLVVAPPAAQKPIVIAKATPAAAPPQPTTGSIDQAAAPAPAAPAPKKVAKKAAIVDALGSAPAAAPAAGSVATTSAGNGYVAVLASVPRSDSSRMDALKRFADMQQKYGSVLGGKTPDVAEANLGAKGAYHRLVVGPPGSREQANALCGQLKSQGYADCWVTSY